MMRLKIFSVILIFMIGCSSSQKNAVNRTSKHAPNETSKDVSTALKSMAEAVSNKELNQDEIQALSDQIIKDREARTAVESITNVLEGKKATTKYCPKDGKRYSAHLEFCPGTEILLEIVE